MREDIKYDTQNKLLVYRVEFFLRWDPLKMEQNSVYVSEYICKYMLHLVPPLVRVIDVCMLRLVQQPIVLVLVLLVMNMPVLLLLLQLEVLLSAFLFVGLWGNEH